MTSLSSQRLSPLFNLFIEKLLKMYTSSKLSSETKSFIQAIPQISKSSQEVVAVALAKVVANELPLPSAPVESAMDFYLTTTYANTRELISAINELVVVDLARIQELVKTFWLVRYNILFPRKKLFQTNQIVSESHFFGFSSLLSPTDAIFIQQNSLLLIQLSNGFAQMIEEMNTNEV